MRLLKLAVHLLEITPINAELMSNTLSLGEKTTTPSIYYNQCTSYDWSAVLIEHVCKFLLK